MNTVQSPAESGQEPAPSLDAHAWATEVRALLAALRPIVFDAVAPRGERKHSRGYLRRTLKARLRGLEWRLDNLDPPAPGEAERSS